MAIVHDPQPAAMCSLVGEKARHWVWRCHIDLSTPNPATIERLLPSVNCYPAAVFHMPHYVPAGLDADAAHRAAGDRPAGPEEHGLRAR